MALEAHLQSCHSSVCMLYDKKCIACRLDCAAKLICLRACLHEHDRLKAVCYPKKIWPIY